jgi:hypothetical protein
MQMQCNVQLLDEERTKERRKSRWGVGPPGLGMSLAAGSGRELRSIIRLGIVGIVGIVGKWEMARKAKEGKVWIKWNMV